MEGRGLKGEEMNRVRRAGDAEVGKMEPARQGPPDSSSLGVIKSAQKEMPAQIFRRVPPVGTLRGNFHGAVDKGGGGDREGGKGGRRN